MSERVPAHDLMPELFLSPQDVPCYYPAEFRKDVCRCSCRRDYSYLACSLPLGCLHSFCL